MVQIAYFILCDFYYNKQKKALKTSLVGWWLRFYLPLQGVDLIPDQRTKVPRATGRGQNLKKKKKLKKISLWVHHHQDSGKLATI